MIIQRRSTLPSHLIASKGRTPLLSRAASRAAMYRPAGRCAPRAACGPRVVTFASLHGINTLNSQNWLHYKILKSTTKKWQVVFFLNLQHGSLKSMVKLRFTTSTFHWVRKKKIRLSVDLRFVTQWQIEVIKRRFTVNFYLCNLTIIQSRTSKG